MGPSDKDERPEGPAEESASADDTPWGTLDDESLLLDEDFIQRILDGDDNVNVPEEFLLEDPEEFKKAVAAMLAGQEEDKETADEAPAGALEVAADDVAPESRLGSPLEEPLDVGARLEPEPEKKSLYNEIKGMAVGQKIKVALKGGREARNILMRDSNMVVKRLVLRNPRITEDEILILTRNKSEEKEFLDFVAARRDWMRNYQIRLALVTNPKTPLPLALRLVNTMLDKDLRQIAKSKNVTGAVNSAAKRTLFRREKKP